MNVAILFMAFITGGYALLTQDDILALMCTIFMVTAMLGIYIDVSNKGDE